MANFQPLHKDTHGKVKLKQAKSVDDLKTQHALGVVLQEFALAGANYPIAFVKEEAKDSFFPVAILGLEQSKNLFVSEDGKWTGMYMPARYTHKPLSVIPNKDDANLFGIAIDMDNGTVNEVEGESLFTEAGEESEYLNKRKSSLMSYIEHEQITKAFCDTMKESDLFTQQNVNVKVKDKEYSLNGLHMIDEKKLNELSDEDYIALRKRGFLGPIYAHLSSMHQMTSLIQKQSELLK